jgi:hypothetical protein
MRAKPVLLTCEKVLFKKTHQKKKPQKKPSKKIRQRVEKGDVKFNLFSQKD